MLTCTVSNAVDVGIEVFMNDDLPRFCLSLSLCPTGPSVFARTHRPGEGGEAQSHIARSRLLNCFLFSFSVLRGASPLK